MRKESIDCLVSYLKSQSSDGFNEFKSNCVLMSAKIYDDPEKIKKTIEMVEDEKLYKILRDVCNISRNSFHIKPLMSFLDLFETNEFKNILSSVDNETIIKYIRENEKNIQFTNNLIKNCLKNADFAIHHTTTANLDEIKKEGLKPHLRESDEGLYNLLQKIDINYNDLFMNHKKRDGVFFSNTFVSYYLKHCPEWVDSLLSSIFGLGLNQISSEEATKKFEKILEDKNLDKPTKENLSIRMNTIFKKYLDKTPVIILINKEKEVNNDLIKDISSVIGTILEPLCFGDINASIQGSIPPENLIFVELNKNSTLEKIENQIEVKNEKTL